MRTVRIRRMTYTVMGAIHTTGGIRYYLRRQFDGSEWSARSLHRFSRLRRVPDTTHAHLDAPFPTSTLHTITKGARP